LYVEEQHVGLQQTGFLNDMVECPAFDLSRAYFPDVWKDLSMFAQTQEGAGFSIVVGNEKVLRSIVVRQCEGEYTDTGVGHLKLLQLSRQFRDGLEQINALKMWEELIEELTLLIPVSPADAEHSNIPGNGGIRQRTQEFML
jgi:hypothetical protein